MAGVPTLAEVRAWVAVPATSVSDPDLQQIRDAELSIQVRLCRVPEYVDPGPLNASLDGMAATVAIVGGVPGVHYRFTWGDGQNGDATLDENGDATIAHVYSEAGDYSAMAFDDRGVVVAEYRVTVPGEGTLYPAYEYPAALSRALLRRCQRQVAARNVPLGVLGVESDGFGPINLPSWDAEIARLEASYRIPVVS